MKRWLLGPTSPLAGEVAAQRPEGGRAAARMPARDRAFARPPPPTPPRKGAGSFIALCLVVLSVAAAPPTLAQSRAPVTEARFDIDVERVVSPGGVEAWLVHDTTVPMIVLHADWRGGAAIEPLSQVGVTSVMADMLTEGAGGLDANAFKERLEELNTWLAFSAGWDSTSMTIRMLSENRDASFEMARLALAEPRWDAGPLDRIKRQLLVAIRQRETNPSYIANLAMDQALYPDHPYARRATRDSVLAIDRAALVARQALLMTRDRMRITVVGDIDAATLGPLLDRTFGQLPATSALPSTPQAALNAAVPLIVRELPQPQSLIIFAAPGIQDEDPDWIPLAVANYIIGGGGFSSRLVEQVREQRGLVYGIGTSPSVRDFSALIRGSAQTENADVAEALDVTRAELARFYAGGATQAEVDDAITYLTGSFPLDLDSNQGIASVLHGYHVAGRGIDYINRRNDLIRAVTLEDVNRVIRRLYDPANFTFVVVGQPDGLE
ncbi:MAG: M16 family metallopeptidase [Hyphomonadaceae bacterium]